MARALREIMNRGERLVGSTTASCTPRVFQRLVRQRTTHRGWFPIMTARSYRWRPLSSYGTTRRLGDERLVLTASNSAGPRSRIGLFIRCQSIRQRSLGMRTHTSCFAVFPARGGKGRRCVRKSLACAATGRNPKRWQSRWWQNSWHSVLRNVPGEVACFWTAVRVQIRIAAVRVIVAEKLGGPAALADADRPGSKGAHRRLRNAVELRQRRP